MSLERAKVGFVSLGCPKNLVDSERMMNLLSARGVILTGNQNEADIVVINTCGFLEAAKNESLDTIGEFIDLKKKKKVKGVVVAGCMTERYLDVMKQKYPAIDAFIQTREFSAIGDLVDMIMRGETAAIRARENLIGEREQLKGHSELPDHMERAPGKRSFAYVKISEGCNRVCSFCIIPKLRGKHHSRSIEGVVKEVQNLVDNGTREVIFIAQDLTSYGRDRSDGASLLELLRRVDKIDGLEWFRLMYNYPRFFSDELIEFLKKSEKFSGYLDIPFQHASDRILKLMKRPETSSEIRQLVTKLRGSIPHISLRTTVMVGFPGETNEDFEELLRFVKEMKFDQLGAFTYFREKDTPSHDLEDQVPELTKKQRYNRLMKIQAAIQKEKLKELIGQTLPVRVDAFSEQTKQGKIYRGRHYGQAPEIDGISYVLSENELEIGSLVHAEMAKSVGDYDLLGMVVENLGEIYDRSKICVEN